MPGDVREVEDLFYMRRQVILIEALVQKLVEIEQVGIVSLGPLKGIYGNAVVQVEGETYNWVVYDYHVLLKSVENDV